MLNPIQAFSDTNYFLAPPLTKHVLMFISMLIKIDIHQNIAFD